MQLQKFLTQESKIETGNQKTLESEEYSLMNNLLLIPVPLERLLREIRTIVELALKDDRAGQKEDKLISPAEACKLFEPSISLPTLSSWTNAGHFQSKKIGGRVFYSKKQIQQAGLTLKRYKQNNLCKSV
jgi:hypothetical protein